MSFISQRGQTGPLGLTANGVFQTSTDVALQTLVGSKWDLSDGREVSLGYASSATTVAPGYFYQNPALIANHQGLVVTAFTAYGTSNGVANSTSTPATVTVTLGGTAATVNQYQGGYMVVQSSTGIAQTLKIQGNTAQTSTTGSVVVTLEDAPNTAITTSSVVNLIPQVGYNVVISPAAASLTNTEFGVGLYAIPASNYGFFVTRGDTAVVAVAAGVAAGSSLSVGAGGAGVILSAGLPVLGHTGAAIAASSANIAHVNL
jgi:hypothetical protein